MATSSALGLGDIALVWSNASTDADAAIIDNDLASDRGLMTAVLLSLFLDARAQQDDVPPSGDPTDLRGWWADEFQEVKGDRIGSRLWLLERGKATRENATRAKEYIAEALAWMLEDKVVASVEPFAEVITKPTLVGETMFPAGSLLLGVDIHRPGRDPVSLRFASKWDHMQEAA